MRFVVKVTNIFLVLILSKGVAWANYSSNEFLQELTTLINNVGGEVVYKKEEKGKLKDRISPIQINFKLNPFFENDIGLSVNINYDQLIIEQVSDNQIGIEFSPFSSVIIESENFMDDNIHLLIEFENTRSTIFLERSGSVRSFFTKHAFLSQKISKVFLNGSEIPISFELKLEDYLSSVRMNTDSRQKLTTYEAKSKIQALSIFSKFTDHNNKLGTQITRLNNDGILGEINLSLPDLALIFDLIDQGINPLDKGLSLGFFYERSAGFSESIISNQDFNIIARSEDMGAQSGLGISKNGINFLSRLIGLKLNLFADQLSDLPMEVIVEEASIEMEFPFLNKKNGSNFKFYLNIEDFSLGENVWNLVEIDNDLSANSISLLLDLSGDVIWLLDFMDLNEIQSFSQNSAIEIDNLNVNKFKISFGDVEISGSGSFIFLNKEFQVLADFGLPHPVGQLEVELKGVYNLLDKLMSEQLLDKQTGIFLLGLVTLYTKSGDRDDTLLSVIEFTDSGEILINNKSLQ